MFGRRFFDDSHKSSIDVVSAFGGLLNATPFLNLLLV
jgi:hypothetical protein